MREARGLPAIGAVRTLSAGAIFAGRYEILSAAGRGGMGYVYRARHLGLAKEVALKVVGDGKHDYAMRFAREARAIARLDHPGCVRVLDHGRVDDLQYIAMELLSGETLLNAMKKERFSTARALSITRQILGALAHAHSNGVIHRDIKPENVMLVKNGARYRPGDPSTFERAVLIDFGLASLRDEAPLTAVGMCMGSPSYLAPERLLGKPHDTRTDLYAVGVMLYEMVAGRKPFEGASPEETMRLALKRPPRPLRAFRPSVSAELDKLIRRALAKDPTRRFADAEDMLLAVNDVPSDEERAAAERAAEEAEAAATIAINQLDVRDPSWVSRAWTWVRYGAWRWRAS
jgi:serine/threonine-protein kinase